MIPSARIRSFSLPQLLLLLLTVLSQQHSGGLTGVHACGGITDGAKSSGSCSACTNTLESGSYSSYCTYCGGTGKCTSDNSCDNGLPSFRNANEDPNGTHCPQPNNVVLLAPALVSVLVIGFVIAKVYGACSAPATTVHSRRDETNTCLIFSRDDNVNGVHLDVSARQMQVVHKTSKLPPPSSSSASTQIVPAGSIDSECVSELDVAVESARAETDDLGNSGNWDENVSEVKRSGFLYQSLVASQIRVSTTWQLQGIVVRFMNSEYFPSSICLALVTLPVPYLWISSACADWFGVVATLPSLVLALSVWSARPVLAKAGDQFPETRLHLLIFHYRGVALVLFLASFIYGVLTIDPYANPGGFPLFQGVVIYCVAVLLIMILTLEQVTIRRVHPHKHTQIYQAGLSNETMERSCTASTGCSLRVAWKTKSPTFLLELVGLNLKQQYWLQVETIQLAHFYAPNTIQTNQSVQLLQL